MTDNRLDACLRLVSDSRRRRVIQRLRHETDGTTTVDDLVDGLHAGDSITVTDLRTDRDQLLVELVHVHLPKLEDHGVVEYDRERKTVQYRPDAQIEAVLDSLPAEVAQVSP